jgi:hypothetical protein
MTAQRSLRLGGLSLGKFCRSLILPLLLLCAQQGGLLHELSHYKAAGTQNERDPAKSDGRACELCLAYAHLDVAAKPDVVAVALQTFVFAVPAAIAVSTRTADAPPAQSRGPPLFL